MMDIPGLIKERQLDAMRSLGRKLGAGRERHIEVFNPGHSAQSHTGGGARCL